MFEEIAVRSRVALGSAALRPSRSQISSGELKGQGRVIQPRWAGIENRLHAFGQLFVVDRRGDSSLGSPREAKRLKIRPDRTEKPLSHRVIRIHFGEHQAARKQTKSQLGKIAGAIALWLLVERFDQTAGADPIRARLLPRRRGCRARRRTGRPRCDAGAPWLTETHDRCPTPTIDGRDDTLH